MSLPIIFLRNIKTGILSTEDANKEQTELFKEIRNTNKGEKSIEKKSFL